MSKEYLKDIVESAGFYIHKNTKPDRVKFTYDPTIQIDGYRKEIHEKISDILINYKISHSKKQYDTQRGLSYRIVITSIFNISQLFDITGINFKGEKLQIFNTFLEMRIKKLVLNKKARYGEEEENLYQKLRQINGMVNLCKTQRIEFIKQKQ